MHMSQEEYMPRALEVEGEDTSSRWLVGNLQKERGTSRANLL